MHDVEAVAAAFATDGFVVVEDAFDADVMSLLEARSFEHFGTKPAWFHNDQFLSISRVEVVPWFPEREGDQSFGVVSAAPIMTELTDATLGPDWQGDYCMVMHSRAESAGQAWHQDCPPERPDHFNLNRLVYVHDVGGSRGGELAVVPGSHRRGVVPVGEPHESLPDEVILVPRKGTLVLVHGHCWHRVLAVGDQPRVSINYRALPALAPPELTDVCVYRNMRYRFSTSEVVEQR